MGHSQKAEVSVCINPYRFRKNYGGEFIEAFNPEREEFVKDE